VNAYALPDLGFLSELDAYPLFDCKPVNDFRSREHIGSPLRDPSEAALKLYGLLRACLCLVKCVGLTVACMKSISIQRRETGHVNSCHAARRDARYGARHDTSQLRVNVIATKDKGTISALHAATCLAANLGAQIALIAVEVVPLPYLLKEPPVPVFLLERRLCGLIHEAGIFEEKIRIQLCLCRDQCKGLKKILQPHSLVVLGGHDRWWSKRERRLNEFLTGLGHQVIAAQVRPDGGLDTIDRRIDVAATKGTVGQAKWLIH